MLTACYSSLTAPNPYLGALVAAYHEEFLAFTFKYMFIKAIHDTLGVYRLNTETPSLSGRDLGGPMGTSGGHTIHDAGVDELDSALRAREI